MKVLCHKAALDYCLHVLYTALLHIIRWLRQSRLLSAPVKKGKRFGGIYKKIMITSFHSEKYIFFYFYFYCIIQALGKHQVSLVNQRQVDVCGKIGRRSNNQESRTIIERKFTIKKNGSENRMKPAEHRKDSKPDKKSAWLSSLNKQIYLEKF